MKKTIKFLSLVPVLLLSSCKSGVKYDISKYILELEWKEDFTIYQLTDTHLGDKDDLPTHYKFMDYTYDHLDKKPDMIVVTGDLFTFASRSTAKGFFSWLDSKEVPWTVTFGNHDEQCFFSVDWLTGYLNELSNSDKSHCVFKDLQDDDVHGNANFAINLKDGSTIKEQIIVMDTNRYYFGKYFGYDYIKQNQIDWYERLVNYTKEQNGGTVVPSKLFYHIPLPEINDAWEKGSKYERIESNLTDKVNFQQKREKTCPPDYNSGFFKKITELGSTNAMFFGHDHINNFANEYEGVLFSYGVKATDRVYFDSDMLGGQTITIKNDHKVDIKQYFYSYEEVK